MGEIYLLTLMGKPWKEGLAGQEVDKVDITVRIFLPLERNRLLKTFILNCPTFSEEAKRVFWNAKQIIKTRFFTPKFT